jgi:hypothetical protein
MDKSLLHDFSLAARELLVREAQEHMESVYGLSPAGTFESVAKLPAVNTDTFAKETRRQLELFFIDETAAGLTKKEAYEKLTKEIAFTWLNRLVAFAMMERRGIIHHDAIGKGIESNGFKRWLAASEHSERLVLFNKGDLPKNIYGEGPRDQVYREFLLWQCGEVAQELAVLFDISTLASRIFPRPRVLHDLLDKVNAAEMQPAWEAGNEETIGWIYQYFNENEKAEVFDRLYKKKQKIRPQDIPAATCLYTPRWIVKYLVQNTLGRQWMQMHPDSSLATSLDYLVPLKGEIPPVPLKPVREITLLDPACGTMHFGLVAFDLYSKMYEEELQNAGKPGWPISSSVKTTDEIPAAILANNIHGIDIDLRAVQLSALTLYLKAKAYRKDAKITQSNLACADILPLDGEHLSAFLKETKLTDPLYERILRALVDQLKLAHYLGSLLKVEEEITSLIAAERKQFEKIGRQVDLSGKSVSGAGADAFTDKFWEQIEGEIIVALNAFAQRQTEQGKDESYFVGETTKGIRLLDLLRQKYDVVVTNPPYSGHKNMNVILKETLSKLYPDRAWDLFSAFISRCLGLTAENGRLGMITIHSFMFISTYEKLRFEINENSVIETGCHLGTKTEFDLSNPNAQGFIAFVFSAHPTTKYKQSLLSPWFRMVQEIGEEKQIAFDKCLSKLQIGVQDPHLHQYRHKDFIIIPGSPWVYWLKDGFKKLFSSLPSLNSISAPKSGLNTADNLRFLRFWWEVNVKKINLFENVVSPKWFKIMKGGEYKKWYGNQEHVINWLNNGFEVRSFPGATIRNEDCYFKKGITFPKLTSSFFNARYSPGGFLFDSAGNSIFPQNIAFTLAILNSQLANYLLKMINPTVNFQVGDLARLPIPKKSSSQLESLVDTAITVAKIDSACDETTFDFSAPSFSSTLNGMIILVKSRHENLRLIANQIDNEVNHLYEISSEDRDIIEKEVGPSPELPTPSREEIVTLWISYAMGIIMGRFSLGIEGALGSAIIDGKHLFKPEIEQTLKSLTLQQPIGILDPADPDDLATRIARALNLMLGETCTNEIIETIGGDPAEPEKVLREYLKKDFWKLHLQWYRKRPIYWLLQTPKKSWSMYLFHERMTADTLFLLKGNRYLGAKMNATRQRMKELDQAIKTAEGRDRKRFEKELAETEDLFADLEAFDKSLSTILEKTNERGEVVGWKPELDDGVILNLAPLRDLMPSWKAEPEKYWKELEAGVYDWSYTAMRYWPDRVLEKCKTNKSFAIAHDQLDIYEGA